MNYLGDLGLAPLTVAFRKLVQEDGGHGAGLAVVRGGDLIVDVREGWADAAPSVSFASDTLVPLYSTGKVVVATMIARLVDRGLIDLDQPVASVWPEFAAAGKQRVTVGELMAHRAGLAAMPPPSDAEAWYDREAVCARLAGAEPLWEPGSDAGYHAITLGHLADELHRRTDGRGIGAAFREDLGARFDLDLWLGLPPTEHGRVADTDATGAITDFGEPSPLRTAVFLAPGSSPGGRPLAEWRAADLPAVNGHGTARDLARLMAALAIGGRLDGTQILAPETIIGVSEERGFGEDLVLPHRLSWGAGFLRNRGFGGYGPSPDAFGHSGWGGSCAFADPSRGIGFAYVPTRHSGALIADRRARQLVDILYDCL